MTNCGDCYYSYKQYNGQAGYVLCDLKGYRIHKGNCCDDWKLNEDEEDIE